LPHRLRSCSPRRVSISSAIAGPLSNVVWSVAGSGTIDANGNYVAPSTQATSTVTAQVGSLSATATVNVVTVGFLGLRDAALASLTQSLFVDQSISRNDMLQILRTVENENDGVVDATDMSDLKTILKNATTLKIPGYVQVLAADVINGNVANATYQGQTLGNLAIGSTASQLDKLIGKWFLGADHPDASGYTYRTASGSLFVGTPSHNDEYQGNLGDCYLISSLGTIADSSSAAIKNMFIDNGDGTWTVRFYANGTADYVTVDSALPTDSSGRLVFADYGSYYASATNDLWIPLAEKAYAQWNQTGKEGRDGVNAYSSIEGGWMADVDAQVLGHSAQSYNVTASTKQTMINALAANKAVTIGTSSAGNGLYGSHAYAVIGYNSTAGTFQLYNPWGSSQPGPLTWSQITAHCSGFVVADTSGSVPISASVVGSSPKWPSRVIAGRDVALPAEASDTSSSDASASSVATSQVLFQQSSPAAEESSVLKASSQDTASSSLDTDVRTSLAVARHSHKPAAEISARVADELFRDGTWCNVSRVG
jgi:hypothetical protein